MPAEDDLPQGRGGITDCADWGCALPIYGRVVLRLECMDSVKLKQVHRASSVRRVLVRMMGKALAAENAMEVYHTESCYEIGYVVIYKCYKCM
jgi:hypothetical protein